jgi:hypothetical protein
MSNESKKSGTMSLQEAPRFVALLFAELDAAGLAVVPKELLTPEQRQHIERLRSPRHPL